MVDTFYWVALPLTTVNGVSRYQPEWGGRENGVEWVRRPPENVITDTAYFPFYRYAMAFEEFVPAFSSWFVADKCCAAILTSVCADESLNRFMALILQSKLRYADDKTWARMCARVSGAASGAFYANERGAYFALRKRISKPEHHTWCSYAMFLLNVMPEKTAEHYRNKIAVYSPWYQTHGYPDDIPDERENYMGSCDIPSV